MSVPFLPEHALSTALAKLIVPLGQAARPFQAGPAEPAAGPSDTLLGEVLGWIAARQAEFYRLLTEALDRFQSDPSAAWLLIGLSLAYGVLHAAGPGHGKAVISAYVLAERQTARRAVALSFAAAVVQATTAVVLVAFAVTVLKLTSVALTRTAASIEIASYAFITAFGAWLVARKVLRPLLASQWLVRHSASPGPASLGAASSTANALRTAPCGHAHLHEHCGHHHLVDPARAAAAARGGWRSQVLIALSVGIRPCSGAIIVLVFAFAQGLAAVGIASAYAMAVGTGATVAVLALIAISAKGLAGRMLAQQRSSWAAVALGGIEALAACAVFALGALLLLASLHG